MEMLAHAFQPAPEQIKTRKHGNQAQHRRLRTRRYLSALKAAALTQTNRP